ncbi:MAG: histidine phosphatase family protein [Neomegalonema sp.]|nr:histidine phosphatase family protein [Neomegalonema sp.]
MTKRFVLMRHAKSSWSTLDIDDHERPLNMRGRLASALMGAWLREQPWSIDLALISTSVRTKETWRLLSVVASTSAFRPNLYHAASEVLWSAVRAAPDSVETLFVLAHNPGIEAFLGGLPRGPRRVPTAALAVIEWSGEWADARPDLANIVAYEEPKGLV